MWERFLLGTAAAAGTPAQRGKQMVAVLVAALFLWEVPVRTRLIEVDRGWLKIVSHNHAAKRLRAFGPEGIGWRARVLPWVRDHRQNYNQIGL
jgi:hypothetical protein